MHIESRQEQIKNSANICIFVIYHICLIHKLITVLYMSLHRNHWNAMKWSPRPVQGLCSWWFAGTRLPKFGHTSQKRGWIRGALRFAWCMRWEMMFGALMFLGTAFKQNWPFYITSDFSWFYMIIHDFIFAAGCLLCFCMWVWLISWWWVE